MIKPPEWMKIISSGELFEKFLKSQELNSLIKHAERDYVYWDKFKHYPLPKGFNHEQAWAYLKFSRLSNRDFTPVRDVDDKPFAYTTTKTMYEQLSKIDKNTSGYLWSDSQKPTITEKNQLIISNLTEEAIASSQIEGANTSRKVAKQMLLSGRKARNKDEQMIINNYQVMQRLMDWKDLDISLEMLIDIQKNITLDTLEDVKDEGRFREDSDEIAVVNRTTGETVFDPPPKKFIHAELKRLIDYANKDKSEEDFIHPVVKASILHFWLAYLHPFIDGNGRTSRAIFYWYLLKHDYWMFEYLSVSRIIKKSKKQYDNAFLHTEYDDNDLTYFLSYKLKTILNAISDLKAHYKEKIEKDRILLQLADKLGDFNERQISLLQYFNNNRDQRIDVKTHQNKYRVAYETARADLMLLVKKNFLSQVKSKNKYVFIPNTVEIKKIFRSNK
ncbi:Fic family protein [Pedobacter sp.]|uniref:Fic family protein n=1 Tax=Pedobacter sp. TaxID=1411316 RepID=UPI002CB65839|nr:Fic family protein [Pedobacter sp.]HWW42899.1 Fic family protein [Pedobacter sp.]